MENRKYLNSVKLKLDCKDKGTEHIFWNNAKKIDNFCAYLLHILTCMNINNLFKFISQ